MRTAVPSDETRVVEGALALGYLALGVGILAAYTSPVDGYEVSIYGAAPVVFWIALFVVAVISITVTLYDRRYLPLAVLLGGLGAAAVAGLPLIRGYHFFGRADALIHLGWTRALNVGADPLNLFYPGNHLIAMSISKVAGTQITRAMLLVVWLHALLFYMAVSLCVWFLVPDRRGLAVGAFSAFLLLPMNNISTRLQFHTNSMALLFVPLVLYLVFTHLTEEGERTRVNNRVVDGGNTVRRGLTGFRGRVELSRIEFTETVPTSYLLPLASVALVLFHPQVALNVIILLCVITVTQHWYRRYRPEHAIAEYRLLTFQAAFLLLVFIVWIDMNSWEFVRTAETMVQSMNNLIEGTASTTPQIESQGDSAEAIGTSLWELFAKLFGVEVVYALLAAGIMLGRVSGYLGPLNVGQSLRKTPDTTKNVITLFFIGVLALIPFFTAFLVGSISEYLFRYVGFMMVLATIFGAVGVRYLLGKDAQGTALSRPWMPKVATIVIVLMMLSLSVATLFPSPFLYLPGSHVSEGEMDGYERAFASQSPEAAVWFGGVRTTSDRYEVALYGAESAPWERQVTPPPKKSAPVPNTAMLNSLTAFYATHPEKIVRRDHYFVVSEADRQREIQAYGELRYSAAGFEAVEAQPDVGKVRDNGELVVYFVDIPTDASTNTTVSDAGTISYG